MQLKLYTAFLMAVLSPCLLQAQPAADFNSDFTSGCGPLKVKFADLSTVQGSDNIISWQWDFGDGSGSAQKTPTHVYANDGYYTVKLKVTTYTGASDSASKTNYIAVGNFLLAKLGNDTAICSGATITLDAGNANTGATWLWSNGATTQTIAAGAGTWSVIVSQRGCTAYDTIVIGNSAPLSSQIGYKILTACLPVAVQFTDASAFCPGNTIYKWQWTFGDGATSTLQNPIHSYATTGSFTVKLTVTTTNNLTSTRSKSIAITNGTAPVVKIGNDSTVCRNAGFVLDAANTGATYLWSTNETTQTIAITQTGTYWVTVNKNGCIGKDTAVITVNPSPVVSLGKDTAICIGTSLQLDAGSQAGAFLWSTGANSRQISVSGSGTYWVKADLGACSSRDTIAISTQNAVTPALGYTVTSTCLPVLVKFTDSSVVRCGPVTQWHWDFGDGSTSNQQHPQHTYTTAGSFTALLELSTGMGPAASVYKTINIQNVPPVVQPSAGLTACKGKTAQLTAGIDSASYRWTPATGLSIDTIENPVLTADTTIRYHVAITKCFVTQYRDILVSVDSIGKPVITAGDTTLISSEAPFYQWYKDNTALPGAVSGVWYPGASGAYTVKVHNANGCEAMSDAFVYVPKNKTGNLLKNIYVNCSPNPGPGVITIALSSVPAGGITTRCMDRNGKSICTMIIRNSSGRLDLARYPKGVYFIVMEYDGARLTVPVVTQ